MHSLADLVRMKDEVIFRLGRKLGDYLIANKDRHVEVVGHLTVRGIDDRGNTVPGTFRDGDNVCTNTGREWLARLMSYASYNPDTAQRSDRIKYFGLGTGTGPEVPGVTKVITPIPWNPNYDQFLATVNAPATYPLTSSSSSSTAVRYTRVYEKTDISVNGHGFPKPEITEFAMFTDGSPFSSYAPGTRLTNMDYAADQPPMFYKCFEALKKTQRFALEATWEVRF